MVLWTMGLVYNTHIQASCTSTLQYGALRSQLGMRSDDMVKRIRELGATATPMKAVPGVGR